MDKQQKAKEETTREIIYLLDVQHIKDKEKSSPWIIIDEKDGKIRIIINQSKKYRVMHNKNLIETSLDMLIVDSIKELLKGLSVREAEMEEEFKNGGADHESKVRKPGDPGKGNTKTGPGGTETGDSGFV